MNDNKNPTSPGAGQRSIPKTSLLIVLAVLVVGLSGLSAFLLIDKLNQKETTPEPVAQAVVESDTTTLEPVENPNAGPYIADGYFVVPKWQTKFKLSDNLTDYGYSVSPDSIGASFGSYVVGLTAVHKDDLIENPQQRYYASVATCSLVTVSQTTEDLINVGGPSKVIESGDVSYVVFDYQANFGCPELGDSSLFTKEYYDKIASELTEILSHPEAL